MRSLDGAGALRPCIINAIDGSLRFWDVQQGRELQAINHCFEVYGVVFGVNGLLANSAENGAVRVWRTEIVERYCHKAVVDRTQTL